MKEFTSQVCTDIHQSQRLLEMGLKPETADMVYEYEGTYPYDCNLRILEDGDYISSTIITEDIPAWSLHRLKCLLPNKIPYKSGYLTIEIINNVNLMFITDTSEQRVISFIHENLYESIIKCIKWLIKEDYFNKEYLKQ